MIPDLLTFSGWARWALAHPEFGVSVNPIPIRGQIMPTTLLLADPDLKSNGISALHWALSLAETVLITSFSFKAEVQGRERHTDKETDEYWNIFII